MVIKILGTDIKSRIVYENTVKAIKEAEIKADIIRITEIDEIVKMGVIMTPAISVDEELKAGGRILKQSEIIAILKGEKVSNCPLCPASSLPGTCSCCN